MTIDQPTTENRQLGDLAMRAFRWSLAVGLVGLAISLVIGWRSADGWERFFRSYLVAFCFVLSLSLGGLFFTLMQHLARAGWSVVLRRVAEALAGNLTWIWILFVPIAIGMLTGDLYSWNDTALRESDELLIKKAPYLNASFWLIRAGIYFAIWALIARFFFRVSVAQDQSGDPHLTSRLQSVSAVAMILYAFTQSFAIIDWVMTLEFGWFSTILGVYFFAATCCGFGATMILLFYGLQRAGRLSASVSKEHYQEMGKFLFAFGIFFWGYIAYSQYMLIWYGNMPEETGWFIPRQLGAWGAFSLFLLFGHFCGPFLILISRHPKRMKGVLAVAAGWMLFMHLADLYWLVMPRIPPELSTATSYAQLAELYKDAPVGFHPLDLTCLVALGGLAAAGVALRLRRCSLIPIRDPRLHESLAFENI